MPHTPHTHTSHTHITNACTYLNTHVYTHHTHLIYTSHRYVHTQTHTYTCVCSRARTHTHTRLSPEESALAGIETSLRRAGCLCVNKGHTVAYQGEPLRTKGNVSAHLKTQDITHSHIHSLICSSEQPLEVSRTGIYRPFHRRN